MACFSWRTVACVSRRTIACLSLWPAPVSRPRRCGRGPGRRQGAAPGAPSPVKAPGRFGPRVPAPAPFLLPQCLCRAHTAAERQKARVVKTPAHGACRRLVAACCGLLRLVAACCGCNKAKARVVKNPREGESRVCPRRLWASSTLTHTHAHARARARAHTHTQAAPGGFGPRVPAPVPWACGGRLAKGAKHKLCGSLSACACAVGMVAKARKAFGACVCAVRIWWPT